MNIWKTLSLAGALLVLAGCGSGAAGGDAGGTRWPPYRYRLTVEVETPQGLRSGSSVIEVQVARTGSAAIPVPRQMVTSARGEAVAVDVAPGQTLYALLRSDEGDEDWAVSAPGSSLPPFTQHEKETLPDTVAEAVRRVTALRGVQVLPRWLPPLPTGDTRRSNYPLLVTFANPADPKTVTRVDPENLARTFGKGVRLKRITTERTDDPVTTGIEKRLGWLPKYYDRMLDGSTINNSNDFTNTLSQIDFEKDS